MSIETSANLWAGIDIGSGRVTCLVGQPDRDAGTLKIVGGSTVICRGIRAGVVVNTLETRNAIARALGEARGAAAGSISSIWVGLRGDHLRSLNSRGTLKIEQRARAIMREDVDSVVAKAADVPLPPGHEVLHVAPQRYLLDGECQSTNPVGKSARLLEVDAHVVIASEKCLQNLLGAVPRDGVKTIVPMPGLLVVGELVVPPVDKETGCVLLDFGGQSIGIAIYGDGVLQYSSEIPYGSDLIARDLALGLRTSFAMGEKIMIAYGVADESLVAGDADIELRSDDGRSIIRTRARAVAQMIGPRVEEIFAMSRENLERSGFRDIAIPGDCIMTGGGSLLRGVVDAAQKFMGQCVRQGIFESKVLEADPRWLSPQYSTAAGLLHSAFQSN